jgi:hypothetical protein
MVLPGFDPSTRKHPDCRRTTAAAPLLRSAALVAVAVAGLLTGAGSGWAGGGGGGGSGDGSSTSSLGEAMKPSSAEQMALSEHLRRSGVLFYGAWWCPACFKQKDLFGKEAGNQLPYVECDKTEAGRDRCRAAEIRAFPTWVMGKNRLEGVQTIEQLKKWSGFRGG